MKNGWFKMQCFDMKWLQLRQIRISEIENEAFFKSIFRNLEYLEIFDVPLRILRSGTFNGLFNLKVLSMVGLNLHRIEKNTFAAMPRLAGVSLYNCGPNKISLDNIFGGSVLRILRMINIEKCDLGDIITDQSFVNIPSISTLTLVSDNIEIIGPNALDIVLRRVKKLFLRYNKLKSVPNDLFKTNHPIEIDLTGNPFHCDCQMENLRIYEQTTTSASFSGIICVTPVEFHGISLRNCPFLCKETILPYTEVNKSIQRQPTTVKPHPNSQNENQQHVNVHEKINLICENLTYTPHTKKMITLTKSSHKIGPVVQIEEGQLHIDTVFLKNDFKLIELNHFQSNEFDEIISNNEKSCAVYYKSSKPIDIQIKRKLQPEILHRFCWTEKSSGTILPLDCITFHLNEEDASLMKLEGKDLDAWIMEPDKPIVITVCVLFAIFAPVIGILIAIALTKLFPTWIRGQMTDLKESATKHLGQILTLKEQGAFNQLRYMYLNSTYFLMLIILSVLNQSFHSIE